MKKIIALVFTLALFTGCENEPLDGNFAGVDNPTTPGNPSGENPGGGDSGGSDLALSSYSYDITSALPMFGDTVINTDFTMNTNNKVTTLDVETLIFGTTINANATITRNTAGKITTVKNFLGSVLANQTNISYLSEDISSIVYDDFQDDEEDYTYNFTHSGTEINRIEVGTTETVTYTFNSNNQLIKKEYFDAGASQQIETLTYDTAGNITQSQLSGGFNDGTTSYGFDANTNPLKAAFIDQYFFGVLNEDADTQAASSLVLFNSTNNWNSITTADGVSTFTIQYNTANRIISRNGNFDLGDGVSVTQSEVFNYVN